MRLSKSEKLEEKSSEKTIIELDITFNDGSEISFRTPDDQWITTYDHYLLILHLKGRIYIPWNSIKKALEYKVVIHIAEN